MLRHVLVPLDGSVLAEEALAHAQDIVAKNGKITLLTVIELPAEYDYALVDIPLTMTSAGALFDEEEYQIAHENALSYLRAQAQILEQRGFTVDCVVEAGVPSLVIVEQARLIEADTIVISTHGRTGVQRWIFGSVTQKVISQMPCPVMVVPGIKRQPVREDVAVRPIPATG
jgi:nucleotide-binding universal stress UspA family protein